MGICTINTINYSYIVYIQYRDTAYAVHTREEKFGRFLWDSAHFLKIGQKVLEVLKDNIMKKILESSVENRLVKRIKAMGGMCLKFNPIGMAGMPDREILLPGAITLWVELKRPGEKPRPLQLKRKKDLEALGFRVDVLDSFEEVERYIREINDDI